MQQIRDSRDGFEWKGFWEVGRRAYGDSDIDVDCQGRKRAGFWGNFTMHANELNPTICVEADCMVRKL